MGGLAQSKSEATLSLFFLRGSYLIFSVGIYVFMHQLLWVFVLITLVCCLSVSLFASLLLFYWSFQTNNYVNCTLMTPLTDLVISHFAVSVDNILSGPKPRSPSPIRATHYTLMSENTYPHPYIPTLVNHCHPQPTIQDMDVVDRFDIFCHALYIVFVCMFCVFACVFYTVSPSHVS